MSAEFDPYYEWLGIKKKQQPPHHYRLLGIDSFEDNLNVIERAADRQMAHLRTFQNGQQAALSQKLLNEVSVAKVCLLNADKKAEYDHALKNKMAAAKTAVRKLPQATPPPAASQSGVALAGGDPSVPGSGVYE